jgi:hypothetical protein
MLGSDERESTLFHIYTISAILWWSVLLVEETGVSEKTTNLLQVTDKLKEHNYLILLI